MNRLLPMINAELLKLRKRRGLFWFALFLSALSIVIINAIITALHVSDPTIHPAAGGLVGFIDSLGAFAFLGGLAAVLVGATAGAQDVGSGVFRSLVSTGRSRVMLGFVRIPGALAFLLPLLALGFGLEVVAAYTLADGAPTPDLGVILSAAAWLLATGVLNVVVALGVAALLRSRGTAIGVMLAWELVGSRILESIQVLGQGRAVLSIVALDRLLPNAVDTFHLGRSLEGTNTITVTLAVAIVVVIAWVVVFSVLGIWRTATQDA